MVKEYILAEIHPQTTHKLNIYYVNKVEGGDDRSEHYVLGWRIEDGCIHIYEGVNGNSLIIPLHQVKRIYVTPLK